MNEETKELVVIEEANIPALFVEGGSDPIIEGLKREAAKFEGDISTKKGRDEIKSFARKFSTSKTYLEGLGKALSDEYRAKIAPINEERNKIKACCDELRDQVRKPLTEWEDTEKKRVAGIEERIRQFEDYVDQSSVFEFSHEAKELLDIVKAIDIDDSFEEFELAATKAKATAVTLLESKFIVLQNQEKEAAEVKRLEEERLEGERIKREEKLKQEAAEEATRKAEEKAKSEQEARDKTAQDAIDKAKQATLDAELAAATADRERREAEARAKEKADLAVEDEKRRVAEDKRLADIKEQKRQDNVKNRNKIHKEAIASLVENGLSEKDARIFVTMVKDGLVKHISINY